MGDADNRLLSNYNEFKKIQIKININRKLEYVRKSSQKTTEYSFFSNTCRTYIKIYHLLSYNSSQISED